MVTEKKKQVPVLSGVWTKSTSREKPSLIGSKCPYCGEIYFPRKNNSHCVHCQKDGLKDIKLSRRGKINTFTVIMQQPGGGYYHGPVPYAMGIVELPEGVYIPALLKADKFDNLSVGMDVELIVEKIWEDEMMELIGYKFQPIEKA